MIERPLQPDRPFILDMDGVLYRGDDPADGLADLFSALRPDGFVCVTNNSLHDARDLQAKLARMGVDLPRDRFVPVAEAVREHLVTTAAPETRVFTIGARALHDAVRRAGMRPVEQDPEIVVLGLDLDQRFEQLATATMALRDGARLVATSEDPILLTESSAVPGTGAFVALLQTCAAVAVELVGKPHGPMFGAALRILGADAEDVVVVGDSVTADIAGGRAIGATTVLLASGVTENVASRDHGADHTFANLRELVDHLRGQR